MEETPADHSWRELTDSLSWREILMRYLEASQRVSDYCESHKEACGTSTELSRHIGGLVVAYIGLRRIILDPLRYEEKAEPAMSASVLYLATQILKDIPAQEKAGAA